MLCLFEFPMAETDEIRRKRLLFRSWHRGTREADLLLGSFAARHLPAFDRDQLAVYERLLAQEDPDIWDWVTGAADPPPQHDTEVLHLLRNFRYTPGPA